MAQDINVNITNGVTEVNGVIPDINGVITIYTGDIPQSVNGNFVSDAQLSLISNDLSGINTGDQTLQTVTDLGNTTDKDIQFADGVGVLLNNTSRLREGTRDSGAGGGIAQVCAVGYELKWEAGSQYVMDGNGVLIREVNHKFTSIPDANNDDSQGFYVGSRWILDDGSLYICTDSTFENAVWELQTIDAVPTNGSTKAVESNGVFDALADKVDKVAGSRLITSAESTILGNTSGTNSGNQSLSGVTALGAITADNITVQALNKQSGLNNSEIYSTDLITGARCSMNSNGSMGLKNATTFEVLFKATNATASYNIEAPVKSAGTYTLALTSDLTSLAPLTTATTGSVISFATPQIYNTFSSPSTANITDDLTGAKIGFVQKIYSNKAVAPTVPAGWVLMGTGTYTTSTLNVIFAEWVSGTRVEYWITKPA
jgi:hypothetical protein